MEDIEIMIRLLFATALGGIIGSERESVLKQRFAGVRTFALTAIFGAVCGVITFFKIPFSELFPVLGLIGVSIYTYYLYGYFRKRPKKMEIVTIISVPLCYLVGLFAGYGLIVSSITMAFIILGVLSIGRTLHKYIEMVNEKEINEIIQFCLILFIVFPLMPKEPIFINGFGIDLIMFLMLIILISFINLFAFLVTRLFKMVGVLTAFMGGIINASLTIQILGKKVKKNMEDRVLLLFNSALFGSNMRNMFLTLIVMPGVFFDLLPLFVIISVLLLLFIIFIEKTKKWDGKKVDIKIEQPFSLISGIKSAGGLFVILSIFNYLSNISPAIITGVSIFSGAVSSALTIISIGVVIDQVGAIVAARSVVGALIGGAIVFCITCQFYQSKRVRKIMLVQTLIFIALLVGYTILFLV